MSRTSWAALVAVSDSYFLTLSSLHVSVSASEVAPLGPGAWITLAVGRQDERPWQCARGDGRAFICALPGTSHRSRLGRVYGP